MRRRDYELGRRRIRYLGIRRRGESLDPDVAVRLGGEVDIKEMIGRVLWMESDAQQSAFSSAQNSRRDVEKRRRLEDAVSDDADSPALLDDENASVIERLRQENRARQSGGDERIQLESNAWRQRRSAIARTGGVGVTGCDRERCYGRTQHTNHA